LQRIHFDSEQFSCSVFAFGGLSILAQAKFPGDYTNPEIKIFHLKIDTKIFLICLFLLSLPQLNRFWR